MPQLDILSYASQFFWLSATFFVYYGLVALVMLPSLGTLLKVRASLEGSNPFTGTGRASDSLLTMYLFAAWAPVSAAGSLAAAALPTHPTQCGWWQNYTATTAWAQTYGALVGSYSRKAPSVVGTFVGSPIQSLAKKA
jgi:hypothetical protein